MSAGAVTPAAAALSWDDLTQHVRESGYAPGDTVNGATSAQATLRLFGHQESEVRVTLFRDHHAWCPYCQKVWLWLEEHRIPYRIRKVTMFCYGTKESWYKQIVPSGMLPAVQIDGKLVTESDDILFALESVHGALNGQAMGSDEVVKRRRQERLLFRAWCQWLCYPSRSAADESRSKAGFVQVAKQVESMLQSTPGPFFLDEFGTCDVIFTPYIERMAASLYYYKGYDLRAEHPVIGAWFAAMEQRETYRGTMSDFHTHAHDLPPQMGGCYSNDTAGARACSEAVDCGPWSAVPDVDTASYPDPADSKLEAAFRVLKHRETVKGINPLGSEAADEAMRAALTRMLTGEDVACDRGVTGADAACQYICDRISVPRDMSTHAAKHMRHALRTTALASGGVTGADATAAAQHGIPYEHRRDQNPVPFTSQKSTSDRWKL